MATVLNPQKANELSGGQQWLLARMCERFVHLHPLYGSHMPYADMTGKHSKPATVKSLVSFELIKPIVSHRYSNHLDTYCITGKGWEWGMQLRGNSYPMPSAVAPEEMHIGYGVGNLIEQRGFIEQYDGDPKAGLVFKATYTGNPVGWLMPDTAGIAVRRGNLMYFYVNKDEYFIVHKGSLRGYDDIPALYRDNAISVRITVYADETRKQRYWIPGIGRFTIANDWTLLELGTSKTLPFTIAFHDLVMPDNAPNALQDVAIEKFYDFLSALNVLIDEVPGEPTNYALQRVLVPVFGDKNNSMSIVEASNALAEIIDKLNNRINQEIIQWHE